MSTFRSYKDLIVWQKSVDLVKLVYSLIEVFPTDEKFGLTTQIKRSAISIPSNIAEGWGRESSKSNIQFLKISRGSLFELETQLILAKELDFIKSDQNVELLIEEIGKMLNGLIKSIEVKMLTE